MSKIVKTRCTAMNRNNTQCKHESIRSSLCHQHLKQKYGLRIKPSTIAGAGLGLFALRAFKKGERIAEYTGDEIWNKKDVKGAYVLQVEDDHFINAKSSDTAPARFANMCRPNNKNCENNAEFIYDKKSKKAWLVAIKDIAPKQEIHVDYGKDYFKGNKRIKSRVDEEEEEEDEEEKQDIGPKTVAKVVSNIIQPKPLQPKPRPKKVAKPVARAPLTKKQKERVNYQNKIKELKDKIKLLVKTYGSKIADLKKKKTPAAFKEIDKLRAEYKDKRAVHEDKIKGIMKKLK